MDLLRERLRARGQHRACFGGDSSSSSSSNTSYNYSDSRSVSSIDSHDDYRQDNRSFSDSSSKVTTITATDHGAVAAGSALGLEALRQNSTNTAALFTVADRLFSSTKNSLDQSAVLAKELSTQAQSSFESAADIATGNKTMLLIGVAVVGMVALMSMGKR